MTILVTGGAGFIGANFVLDWLAAHDETVVNLDTLTCAGNLQMLASLQGNARHVFVQGGIGDAAPGNRLLAESHVDRSIHGPGDFIETNIVGGWNEKPNIEIVKSVCALLDKLSPRAEGQPYAGQITDVSDRPGHDRRYAIDARELEKELGWKPAETFETGIRKTVQWYLANPERGSQNCTGRPA